MMEKAKQAARGNNNIQVGGDLTVNYSDSGLKITVRLLRLTYFLLTISLICTIIPSDEINQISSIATAILFVFILVITWDLRRGGNQTPLKKTKAAVTALAIASVLSGCSGPMLARVPDPAIVDLVKNYKAGVASGIGMLGFGLEKINIETAARNGGISEVYFADQVRGYGLICFRHVSVFGE